jgi:hypothetical protein
MKKITNIIIAAVSLLTATGVFIHDGRIDRATSSVRPTSAKHASDSGSTANSDSGLSGNPHTHPEKAARTLKGFAYQAPTVPPRESRLKRYMLQNVEPKGRHAFDNYFLPIIS